MTGDLLTEASQEPLASCDAAFSCLLQLGGQRGGDEFDAVHCRNVVNGETLSISRLIELAGDLGLKAEHVRLDWQRLQALGFSHPILVLLKNTNVIVLKGGGRAGISEVAVWDPLDPHGEILFVPREDFERAWTGHALIMTTPPSNGAGMSPSLDFCWFTSAGLELLGKSSARGQNPKLQAEGREEAVTRPEPTARRMPRQADRAIASAMRGELAHVRVGIANERLPPDPGIDAQLSTTALSRPAAERGLSPLVLFCIAAGGILAAAGIGTLLLRNSATDPVSAAITLAKQVWAVAPHNAQSNNQAMQNVTARSIVSVPRTSSALIPAPLPATPAAELDVAAPSAKPAAVPGLAAPLAKPAAVPGLAAPSAKPTAVPDLAAPFAKPAAVPDLAAPSAKPAAAPDLAAPPAKPAAVPDLAAPSAKPAAVPDLAAPSANPAGPSLAAAATAPPDEPDVAAPSAEPGLATPARAPETKTAAPPVSTSGSRLSAEEMAALLARGDNLLSVGDVASARLFYERAVDGGGGLAAIRLGETFDPLFLDRVHLSGARGDPGVALLWYRRARDLGAIDAEVLLKALEAK